MRVKLLGLILIFIGAPLLAQSTGFPSRPRFQSVGVGQAAPASSGGLSVAGTLTVGGVAISAPVSGSYTATTVGCSPNVTVAVTYIKTGDVVYLRVNTNSCTSASTTFGLSGAPVAIRPVTNNAALQTTIGCLDNAVASYGNCFMLMDFTGTLTFLRNGSAAGWTASGLKSWQVGGAPQGYVYCLAAACNT